MHPPIPLLERLREFDGGVDDFYASGFELLPSGEDDGWDPCPENPAFRAWLRESLGLHGAEDPNEIVRAAGDELWEPFAAWIGPLIPDVVSSRRSG
ncbi:hypothetical protein R2B67_23715 [Streptomyces cyaneofuscatus]|uniref:hypothetical protein n=1 Tax=Streptomyces cyaneofuscatus TaxID=66883 RepID=UPI002954260A|nr:hypothetical protein [Streptomyces cyaneofuscatus]WOP11354.1 hypothetical protein R2B67_23715 [Streptomyces cyaneofuscatus]